MTEDRPPLIFNTLGIIPPLQRIFRFSFDVLQLADTAARGEFYAKMFGIGAFSPNDILEKENMNGYHGGDEHFMPLNMMPVGQQKVERPATD